MCRWGSGLLYGSREGVNMDFELDDDVKQAAARAREFANKYFTEELAERADRNEEFPTELVNLSKKEKILDYANPWKVLVSIEELVRKDPGLGISVTISAFGSEVFLLYGNDEQKEKYLNRVFNGEITLGLAVTEAGGGSDVANIKTEAKLEGDHYVLNGGKMFISNGQIADYFIVLARTSPPPSEEKKHRGMSVFVVDSKSPGFVVNKLHGKLGVRATNTAELIFNNVVIPKENLIGEEGKGFYYIMTFFNISRIYVAAQGIGIASGALDRLIEFAKGNGNGEMSEGIQTAIAEIATRIEATRNITYKAASYLFKFNPNPVVTSMAKYYAADTAVFATRKAMEILSYHGLTSDLERFFRDAKILDIWEGTSEVEKLIITRMMLKGGAS
ncbi:MAG: acyl-CoA dehydrogenase family protein [Thermoplasmatales archaeon]